MAACIAGYSAKADAPEYMPLTITFTRDSLSTAFGWL